MAEVKEIRPGNVMPSEYSSAELKYEPNSHKYKKKKLRRLLQNIKRLKRLLPEK